MTDMCQFFQVQNKQIYFSEQKSRGKSLDVKGKTLCVRENNYIRYYCSETVGFMCKDANQQINVRKKDLSYSAMERKQRELLQSRGCWSPIPQNNLVRSHRRYRRRLTSACNIHERLLAFCQIWQHSTATEGNCLQSDLYFLCPICRRASSTANRPKSSQLNTTRINEI